MMFTIHPNICILSDFAKVCLFWNFGVETDKMKKKCGFFSFIIPQASNGHNIIISHDYWYS